MGLQGLFAGIGARFSRPPAASQAPARQWPGEIVWGKGFLAPGGAAEILRLLAPLRLAPGAPCLFVNTGLAGPTAAGCA